MVLNTGCNIIGVVLFIVHAINGLPICHSQFQASEQLEDPDRELSEELVAGGMVGIKTMLQEISRSTEDLKVIDHGDQKLLIQHSNYVFIVLNSKEEMRI